MARVGRAAGAIIAEHDGKYFVIGNLKEPAAWDPGEFQKWREIDAIEFETAFEIECDPERLHALFVIDRNNSVSERLWTLVIDNGPGRWLAEIPVPVWAIVRDNVLRCV